jgi:hypothetical protein
MLDIYLVTRVHFLSLAPHDEPPDLQLYLWHFFLKQFFSFKSFAVCLAGDSWDRIDPHHAVYARTVTRAV